MRYPRTPAFAEDCSKEKESSVLIKELRKKLQDESLGRMTQIEIQNQQGNERISTTKEEVLQILMSNPYYVGLDPEEKKEAFDYLYNLYAEPVLEKIQEHCFSELSEEIGNK